MHLTWNCVLLCNNAQAANSANGRSPQDASSGGGSVYFDFHMQMALYVVLKIFNWNERWDYGVCDRSAKSLKDLSAPTLHRSAKLLADLCGRSAKVLADLSEDLPGSWYLSRSAMDLTALVLVVLSYAIMAHIQFILVLRCLFWHSWPLETCWQKIAIS